MANDLHTMPLKCEALLSSRRVRRMKLDEFGAYMRCLVEAWLDGAKLPNDEQEIKEYILGIDDPKEWSRIKKFVVDKMFQPSEDGEYLINPHQVEIWNEVLDKTESNKERAKKGAEARWGKRDKCLSNAQAMSKHHLSNGNQSQSQSQNQRKRKKTKKESFSLGFSISQSLEKSGLSEDIRKKFIDWLSVYELAHGIMAQQAQDIQIARLLKIPESRRMQELDNAIAGQWKNITDTRRDETSNTSETSRFRSTDGSD
jgi:uncharacterized protein YdaU (DUF1376 family)